MQYRVIVIDALSSVFVVAGQGEVILLGIYCIN